MPPEQNQQGRRPNYHRGRRGSDRRGGDRRNVPQTQHEQGGRDGQDVEQIMREIRARISQRHGIELTTQQIQELAARRLEAILDPRTVNPSLLEQLRRSAATAPESRSAEATPAYVFEDRTIYETHNGLLRFIRRMLNPILKLFFNPNPIAHALNAQTKLNAEFATREAERDRRQAEWNALHYDILQRLVTETARVSIEMQSLASRVESLGARVDFNDRRVRIMEAGPQAARPQQRQPEPRQAAAAAPSTAAVAAPEEVPAAEIRPAEGAPTEGTRRRRRRRRGRRSAVVPGEAAGAAAGAQLPESDMDAGEGAEFDEGPDEEPAGTTDTGRLDAEAESAPFSFAEDEGVPPAATPSGPLATPEPASYASMPEPPAEPPSTGRSTAAAAPPPFPQDEEGAATTPPSPPRDEPAPALSEPPESGPEDR